jgi:glycosyltransferase involved in cell wall biosynthesis
LQHQDIKVYRFGPIAAFDKSAHSVSQILTSYYFSLYGIDSYLYMRSLKPEKSLAELESFLGVKFPGKFHVFTTVKHKGLSSFLIVRKLLMDIYKNRTYKNFVFVSKEKHVKLLVRFKRFLRFQIVFENHEEFPYAEGASKADLTYVVSPQVFEKLSGKFSKVILWNYHYPLGDYLFLPETSLFKKEEYLLGYIGSLLPEKGLEFLLKAIREIPNVKLVIIGGNEKQVKNLKKISENFNVTNKVIFKGFLPQSEIPKAIEEIDILIAPFKKEQKTIPLKVYEYMALGKPVLSSDIESIRVVAKDYFFYFEPQNKKSFLETLNFMLHNLDLINRKVKSMRKYAEKFRWNNVIRGMLLDLERI